METGLAGKGVLVTGGSGGIGAACVGAFRGEGARVVAHYHQGRERAEAVGADAIVGGDLRREDDVERVFAEAREALGRIEVCAAVAGVWPQEDVPVWELSLERWEETLRANLTSAFLTARAFLREVERNRHGSLGLLLSLKNEITRIAPAARVNAVAPGWTESPMTRGHVDPDAVRRMTRTMALRKIAQPEDVARQVVVLASDELSGHVTGQVVVVAGGMEGRTLHEE
jgi:3-oxoacyl-[acyl-carrier protein] reductase